MCIFNEVIHGIQNLNILFPPDQLGEQTAAAENKQQRQEAQLRVCVNILHTAVPTSLNMNFSLITNFGF